MDGDSSTSSSEVGKASLEVKPETVLTKIEPQEARSFDSLPTDAGSAMSVKNEVSSNEKAVDNRNNTEKRT